MNIEESNESRFWTEECVRARVWFMTVFATLCWNCEIRATNRSQLIQSMRVDPSFLKIDL